MIKEFKEDKEIYRNIRDTNPYNLIYCKYKDLFDEKKHKPFLTEHQVIQYLQMYMNINIVLKDIIQEYNGTYLNGETEIIEN